MMSNRIKVFIELLIAQIHTYKQCIEIHGMFLTLSVM